MNTHRRYARALTAGAALLASAAVAVGLGGGPLLPAAGLLYGAAVLAWAARREHAAGQARTTRAAAGPYHPAAERLLVLPHSGPLCYGPTGDWLCTMPARDGHTLCVPYMAPLPQHTTDPQ